MTKPVWSHVLALSSWTLKKAHRPIFQYSVAKKPEPRLQISACMSNPHNKAFPPKPYLTVKDILLVSFS